MFTKSLPKRIQHLIHKNIIFRSLNIFSKAERIKILFVVLIQIFLGLLDLIGVVIIGIIVFLIYLKYNSIVVQQETIELNK